MILIAVIIMMESSSNPMAFNREENARGLMQITPIVLKDYNKLNHAHFNEEQLFSPKINQMIGKWYLDVRIPQLLHAKKQPITAVNVLIAWNAGIKHVGKKKLPKETKKYLKRYELEVGHEHQSSSRENK